MYPARNTPVVSVAKALLAAAIQATGSNVLLDAGGPVTEDGLSLGDYRDVAVRANVGLGTD
jgi:hypothetical protein